ncbi:MAG: restriction endonuclease subunit S [Bacteroidota bacterium]
MKRIERNLPDGSQVNTDFIRDDQSNQRHPRSIPPNWSLVKLGDVCTTTSGGTPSRTKKKYFEGKIPWVKSGELNFNIIIDTEEKITKEALENSSAKIFSKGTLLIALYGSTVGRLAFLGVDAATNQAVAAIIPSKDYDKKFIYWFLFNYRDNLLQERIGGAQPNISQGVLKNILMPYPPLPVQHKIVEKIEELFSELDSGVANLRKAKEQIKTYRQSVLAYAFAGKLMQEWRIENGELRVEDNSQFAISNLSAVRHDSQLPTGWKWVKLGEVSEIKRGKSKHRPRNDKKLYDGNYPFIQTGDIRNTESKFVKNFSQTYNEEGLKQSKLWPKGTLCVSIAANIGDTAILGFDSCFPDSVVGIIPKEQYLIVDYIHYYFKKEKNNLEKLAPATAQKNINVGILENILIPLSSTEEQHQIVSEIERRFSVADKLEQTIDESLEKAEQLKQSILKQAFEGRLV